ncbi:3-dehydroquinate synthase [Candidatus Peregrinibacteria bacterium]|jgi:3-dehydroquinate synthase|nr:3-dehydroquinate synthase [Candidatus Peregrinibacteria bacterium]MBT7483904.1 3-dehydroquinate synthase [Candidatus Peregrinibacteria bacterium]MBT7702858.1 3-dehydroquinate synthase [Candidatus Peregrinibacteria bacterium]
MPAFKRYSKRIKLRKYVDNSYSILIAPSCFHQIPRDIKKHQFGQKYCIITDTNVKKLYGEEFLKLMRDQGLDATMISFQAGERHKTLKTVEKLVSQMVQLGHNRKSCVIALGGGVTGDIAGFAASMYMRGIPFIQIPTTLVAMSDSSIGGKTGVDLTSGKNLVGAFTQPKKVYIDPQVLSTLSKKQVKNGLAEIVKHGLISDKGILRILKKNPEKALNAHTTTITQLLIRSCRVKGRVVEKDELEKGLRMILNYGHSIGHAIEHASNYSLNHGEAIAIGMNLENRLAVDKKILSSKNCERIEELLKLIKLPTRIPAKIDRKPILKALTKDKKNQGETYTFTLLKRPGTPKIVHNITAQDVKAVL